MLGLVKDHLCSSGKDMTETLVLFPMIQRLILVLIPGEAVTCCLSNLLFAIAFGYCYAFWVFYKRVNGQRPGDQSLTTQIRVLQCWALSKYGRSQLETDMSFSSLVPVLIPF